MEIRINCEKPLDLKNRILKDAEDGKLETWSVRKGEKIGKILTHTADQFEDKALLVLTPDEKSNVLKGSLIKWAKSEELDYALEAIYIGRFAQVVLTNYEEYFNNIKIIK